MPSPDDESSGPLWVCWTKPSQPIPSDAVVLSFLPPDVEEELAGAVRILERGREAAQAVKPAARRAYLGLVARIGITDCGGVTFRRRLADDAGGSSWWYHPVAFRDCETDPAFNHIIQILTIGAIAGQRAARHVVLVGAPIEVAMVLRSRFQVTEQQPGRSNVARRRIKAIASRFVNIVRQCSLVLRPVRLPAGPIGVFLTAFWDWSFDLEAGGSIRDRYFRKLPGEIERAGIGPTGWLVWIDPGRKTSHSRGRRIANRANGGSPLVFLHSLLRISDVLTAHFDLRPFIVFLRWRQRLLAALSHDGYDFSPLFAESLFRGFADASLPLTALVRTAAERAHRRYQPAAFLSFLEHFPIARAMYRGIAQAGTVTTCFAVQHASYNSDKTFLPLEPVIEFRGEPDRCSVPRPDYVCAMGELGAELFRACGYPADRVLLTGSPRYDSDAPRRTLSSPPANGTIHLLMVSTLNLPLELEMVNAVVAASRDLPLRVRFRNHPLTRIESQPAFERYRDLVEITSRPLDDDLAGANLIVYTYSTVAEEAFVAGKAVWQWLPDGFDGSALAEVVAIPRFGSVKRLRESLLRFIADPPAFAPDAHLREVASRRLFHNGDGGAAPRVASAVARILSERKDFVSAHV